MKKIANAFWSTYPEDQKPTEMQKAWVQRFLELLDPNTSFLFGLGTANIRTLLEEICIEKIIVDKNQKYQYRVIAFVLMELIHKMELEGYLSKSRDIEECNLFESLNLIFKENENKHNSNNENYKNIYSNSDIEKIIKLCNEIYLMHFNEDKYKNHLIQVLLDMLNADFCKIDSVSFKMIEEITKSLIIELISFYNYSDIYLRDRVIEIFLKNSENTGKSFMNRLSLFLNIFIRHEVEYNVFFRVNFPRDFGEFESVNSMIFEEATDIHNKIKYIDNINQQEMDFFLKSNISDSTNIIFALFSVSLSGDLYCAYQLALDALQQNLDVIYTEYESRQIRIDDYAYIVCVDDKIIRKIKNNYDNIKYGLNGNFNKMKNVSEKLKINKDMKNNFLNFAYWHRAAISNYDLKNKFINHWISIEIQSPHKQDKSANSHTVERLAKAVCKNCEIELLHDIWGDINRVGALGNSRVVSPISGEVQFQKELLEVVQLDKNGILHIPVQAIINKQNLIIKIVSSQKTYTIRVLPGSILFCHNRQNIAKGELIAGSILFMGTSIKLPNLWSLEDITSENLAYTLMFVSNAYNFYPEINFRVPLDRYKKFTYGQLIKVFEPLVEALAYIGDYDLDSVTSVISQLKLKQSANVSSGNLSQLASIEKTLVEYQGIIDYLGVLPIKKKFNIKTLPLDVLFGLFYRVFPSCLNPQDLNLLIPLTDQPLMRQRLKSAVDIDMSNLEKLILAGVDRFRRTRNSIMHEGKHPKNLRILVIALYKHVRSYMRLITDVQIVK